MSRVDPSAPAALEAAYRALRTSAAGRALARDVVRVAGPDAEPYLQGQLSQDVAGLDEGATAESLLLSPQGRIDAYLRVGRLGAEEFVLETEAGFGQAVIDRLERFRLRTKVGFEALDWPVTGVRGPSSEAAVATGPSEGPLLRVVADWPGLLGLDLLGPSRPSGRSGGSGGAGEHGEPPGDVEGVPPFLVPGSSVCPEEAWEAARIESGRPVQGREIDERTIAAEVGLVERAVSFTKGCYTGQELVARLDARGSKVARRLGGVVVDAPLEAVAGLVGAAVLATAGGGGDAGQEGARELGRLTSVAWSPGLRAAVALSLLHRSVSPPAPVAVRTTGGEAGGGPGTSFEAEARPLPLVGD
ncbi:MAG TPA: hypothetical protein VKW77_10195 [Acidimicrobiales bacterium]|nr:hypothetical protein [Acidimicrobiales bacterium]